MGSSPDCGEKLAMRHHGASMLGEKCEKFELLGSQPDLFACSLDAMADMVDFDIRDPHRGQF